MSKKTKKKNVRQSSANKKNVVSFQIDDELKYQFDLAKELNKLNIESKSKQSKVVDKAISNLFPGKFKVDTTKVTETTVRLCYVYNNSILALSDEHIATLKERLAAAKIKKEKKKDTNNEYTPSIQDRIKSHAYSLCAAFDEALDDYMIDGKEDALDNIQPLSHLNTEGCKGPQARYIRSFYERVHRELLDSKRHGKEYEDYREAYSYLPVNKRKKVIDFYESIFAACDAIEQKSKIKRKKKTTKKTKKLSTLVKKVNYQKEDQDLMLVSINPENIIGAKQLWIYNTKTRLFGCYHSLGDDGLTIKGTTLQDVALDKSGFKKVRNPEALFKIIRDKKTKRGYNNAYKKLTTKEQKLTARINNNMILLAVFK